MEEEIEEWRVVEGFEKYEVSSFGRVRSLWFGKVKILKQSLGTNGYLSLRLYKQGEKSTGGEIHKLVAIAFHGHKPGGYNKVINHKDEIKTNNRADNIEIISQRENTQKYREGKRGIAVGVQRVKEGRWRSAARINGKKIQIGTFDTEILAQQAYLYTINNPEVAGKPGIHHFGEIFQVVVDYLGKARTMGLFKTKEEADCVFKEKKDIFKGRLMGTVKVHNKWRASAEIKGKMKCLGYFHTQEEAHQVYLNARLAFAQEKSD